MTQPTKSAIISCYYNSQPLSGIPALFEGYLFALLQHPRIIRYHDPVCGCFFMCSTTLKKSRPTADNSNMIETLTQPHDRQDTQAIESETVLTGEPELILPIDEYATRHGISRRTVNRYVQKGRLESTKQRGRTMIIDKPLKPSARDTRHVKPNTDSQMVPFSPTELIRYGFLQAKAKSKTIWQTYAIVVTVLFVALLLLSLWLFTQWRFLIAMP